MGIKTGTINLFRTAGVPALVVGLVLTVSVVFTRPASAAPGLCIEQPLGVAWLAPRDCLAGTCAIPTIGGGVNLSIEFPDAYRAPLQEYAAGGQNGDIALQLDRDTLYIAITTFGNKNPSCGGEFDSNPHTMQILFDSDRAATNCMSRPAQGDRRIRMTFDVTEGGFGVFKTIDQSMGSGSTWVPAPPALQWPVKESTSYDPATGKYTVELAVTLHIKGVIGNPFLVPGKLGLAVDFAQPCGKQPHYYFPNRGPSYKVDPLRPVTWETVSIKTPPSTPMSVISYNVNQLPIGIADESSGDPEHFGFIALLADHTCFQEAWPHDVRREIFQWAEFYYGVSTGAGMNVLGLPSDTKVGDDVLNVPAGDPIVVVATGGGSLGNAPVIAETSAYFGFNDQDTGLLFLSKRPFVNGSVVEYDDSLCAAEDCHEGKGFIWARVLTRAADPAPLGNTSGGEFPPSTTLNASEFLDVFCTHTQANPELPGIPDPAAIRKQQLAALRAYAVHVRHDATDRPALLIGDLNIDGNNGDSAPDGTSEYEGLLALLGLNALTPYDQANSLFSKRYDLGIYGSFTTKPADLQAAFNAHGELGPGTALGACPNGVANAGKRYDYALILPAPDALPTYAIAAAPVPKATVEDFAPGEPLDPVKGTNLIVPVGDECLSDHGALFAKFGLVRIVEPGFWNSSRNHVVSYTVKQVHDLGEDCWGCGDADFFGEIRVVRSDSGGAQIHKDFGPFDDQTAPIINVSRSQNFAAIFPPASTTALNLRWSTKLTLIEDDVSSPDDYYDTDDYSNSRNASTEFKVVLGEWWRVQGSQAPSKIGNLDFRINGTASLEKKTVGNEGSDRARAHHVLTAKEVEFFTGP